jgi:hypothetical protein
MPPIQDNLVVPDLHLAINPKYIEGTIIDAPTKYGPSYKLEPYLWSLIM